MLLPSFDKSRPDFFFHVIVFNKKGNYLHHAFDMVSKIDFFRCKLALSLSKDSIITYWYHPPLLADPFFQLVNAPVVDSSKSTVFTHVTYRFIQRGQGVFTTDLAMVYTRKDFIIPLAGHFHWKGDSIDSVLPYNGCFDPDSVIPYGSIYPKDPSFPIKVKVNDDLTLSRDRDDEKVS